MDTIVIVDDHENSRAVLRAVLEADGFLVIGEAEDGTSALAAARELRPDLVLLDIGLPDMDGFAVAAALAPDGTRPVVILTSSRDAASFGPRLDGGSLRFLPKDEVSGPAIRALASHR